MYAETRQEQEQVSWDFPGGPVVKNLPSSAGDMGSISGQGTKIPGAAFFTELEQIISQFVWKYKNLE